MGLFKLPDLGEGLQDAEIVEWKVSEGKTVDVDELVLVVETAKAIVEIPSPVKAVVKRFAAKEGETVAVGQVLFEYSTESFSNVAATNSNLEKNIGSTNMSSKSNEDAIQPDKSSISVVGKLSTAGRDTKRDLYENFSLEVENYETQSLYVQTNRRETKNRKPAPPAIVAFAKKLGVEDRLCEHPFGELTHHDVLGFYNADCNSNLNSPENQKQPARTDKIIKLKGAHKVMCESMTKSHQHIPSVSLFDDATITHWKDKEDITLRLIEATVYATSKVPLLNAWFDEDSLSVQMFEDVHLGIAVNAEDGLFVPVIRKIQSLNRLEIRDLMDKMIYQVNNRSIKAQKLLGATISLSNFGTLSGRYATPIIVPPQVAIVGVGKIRHEPVVIDGALNVGRVVPLSLSFDHRAASGAEASGFLEAMIESLEN